MIRTRTPSVAVVVSLGCLVAIVVGGRDASHADETGAAAATQPVAKLRTLERGIGLHHTRALAWTRMGYYQRAVRELQEAGDLLQAAKLIANKMEPPKNYVLNVDNEIQLVRLRAEAHSILLRQFALPADTLGFVKVVPYKKIQKDLWAVMYTVPPSGLTEKDIAADPMRYYGYHCPGSRSFIATYEPQGAATGPATTRFKRIAEVALPRGISPMYVQRNSGGLMLVHTTAETPGKPAGGYGTTGVLLREGKLAHLAAGPCTGPIIIPRMDNVGLDGLIVHGSLTIFWAVRRTDKGLVMAEHQGNLFHLDRTVTFEGRNIVEIVPKSDPESAERFSAGDGKPITTDQAILLGRFYGMRHELNRYPVSIGSRYWRNPAVTFDKDKRLWTLTYSWGSMHITGGKSTIVLDRFGKLVSVSQFTVPR